MTGVGSRVVTRPFGEAERPGLDGWLTSPGNRWAFRHTRELFWSERVAAGSQIELGVPAEAPAEGSSIADYLTRSYTDAFVVLHEGVLAMEWYAPGVRADDRHVIFSVTKSVVGLVASALIANGVLVDEASVTDYVPEAAAGGYATATVRDLLNMTANIDFVEDYDGPDVRRYREAAGQLPSSAPEGIHAYVAQLQASGPHGSAFAYISPSADLMGWVCERASGLSLAELVAKFVWKPMGAEHEADLLLDARGASRAGGGLCATARDMARIGLLLATGSESQSAPVRDVLISGDRSAWDRGSLADFLPGAAYRDFWYQPSGDPGRYLAAGIHGQRIYVDIPRRVVVAQQASLPTAFHEQTWLETLPLFDEIARSLADG